MSVTINGTPEEIAALVLAIQERQDTNAVIEEINRRTTEAEHSPILA